MKKELVVIKRIAIALIIVLLLGTWYFYINRNVVDYELKFYGAHEVEKALKELDFEVNLPGYIPTGAAISGVTIHTTNGRSIIVVRYLYGERGFYDLTLAQYVGPIGIAIENNNGFSWAEIQINGKPAWKGLSTLTTEKYIIFTDENINYSLYSPTLDVEEMVKILQSI